MSSEDPDRQLYDAAIEKLLDITADEEKLHLLQSMRANQHRHEQAWISNRSAIVEKFSQKRKLNVVLEKAGGQGNTSEGVFEQEERTELTKYDHKLRFAMHAMYTGQQKEFRSLRIPRLDHPDYSKRLYALLDEVLDGG